MKVSLKDMERLDIFKRAAQPETVYHMTSKDNLPKILANGYIDTMTDFVCYFCYDLAGVCDYIKLSGALNGRKYYDFDGRLHTAKPLDIENTVILKLIPRYIEPTKWFNENISTDESRYYNLSEDERQAAIARVNRFNEVRVAHYGNMKFRPNPEVIPLSSFYKKQSE